MQIGSLLLETFSLTLKWLPRALPLGLLSAAFGGMSTYADNMGYYFGDPMPGYFWGAFALSVIVDTVLMAAILRGILREDWRGITGARLGRDEINVFLSMLATTLIVVIALVIVLLPVIMASLAVFATAGVDLELLGASGGWEQIALTPRIITMGFFVFGLLVCLSVMARLTPYAAGSISQQKVVAMEAFSWTKGYTIVLTIVQIVIVGIMIAVYVLGYWSVYFIAETAGLLQDGVLMNLPLLMLESLFSLPFVVMFTAFSAVVYTRTTQTQNTA